MALINCPECGHEVSDKAEECPKCGYPLIKSKSSEIKLAAVHTAKKKGELSTARFVISIIMLVLSAFVLFQSCAVGIANSMAQSEGIDGTIGFLFSISMIIFGIIGIATRNTTDYKTLLIIGTIMVIIGLLCGLTYNGSFRDLKIWAWLMAIFGLVFSVSGARTRDRK